MATQAHAQAADPTSAGDAARAICAGKLASTALVGEAIARDARQGVAMVERGEGTIGAFLHDRELWDDLHQPVLELIGMDRGASEAELLAEADKAFGGPMPAGCLYAPQSFIDKHPNTTQALATATRYGGVLDQLGAHRASSRTASSSAGGTFSPSMVTVTGPFSPSSFTVIDAMRPSSPPTSC